MNKPVIVPVPQCGGSRTATITGLSANEISDLLGFPPNCDDDEDKVVHSWGFTIDGEFCGVWDYKGSHHFKQFSADGKVGTLKKVFGGHATM